MLESYSDAEVVKVLDEHGFTGPMWDQFADALARAALKTITSWIVSHQIFYELKKKGIRFQYRMRVERYDDALELAGETVARAIVKFRDDMLLNHRWSPDGGACLIAAFITQCLFQFSNEYRRWATEQSNPSKFRDQEIEYQGDEAGRCDRRIGLDPAVTVVDKLWYQELITGLPNDTVRAQVQLFGEGYTFAEAAEVLGVSQRALENQRRRHRQKLKQKAEEAE